MTQFECQLVQASKASSNLSWTCEDHNIFYFAGTMACQRWKFWNVPLSACCIGWHSAFSGLGMSKTTLSICADTIGTMHAAVGRIKVVQIELLYWYAGMLT